ncbi:MAG: AAA family ATPase, partial [Bdellovibrionales bacterium]|nr:AAA family ATPase [Bdellovibrionales bacterium]
KAAEIQNLLKAQQIEYSKMEERLVGLEEKRNGLESQNSQLRVRVESLAKKTEQERARLRAIEDESGRVREERDECSERRNELVTQLSQVREAYGITCQALNEIRLKKEAIQGERQAAADRIQEVEIKLAHEESNFEHQKNISLERYNQQASPQDEAAQLNLEEVPLFQGQVKDEWLSLPADEKDGLMEEHVENLRAKIGRYGEVNLTAIHEFEEVQKRHDFLNTQKADLENSIRILEQAIKRIDETTERRFRETFEGVNEKFQEVFPILFNGGKAKLALTNPENILESGVDIMAMPPGKRLQSISLLSGGEKALTAVSLVLAIFARKPSPFCLLDEVDAPLDEANVSRFNTVIRKMATKSQFILVTHNRKTMDIVDALFGVTMEQAGISKMTSVRLN